MSVTILFLKVTQVCKPVCVALTRGVASDDLNWYEEQLLLRDMNIPRLTNDQ